MKLTREYFDEVLKTLATKKDLDAIRADMATKGDLVAELRPIKNQLSSIEEKIDRLSVRTSEDDVATIKDVEKLTSRLKTLEKEVAALKVKHA